VSGLLTAGEKVEAGRALADVHNWSGSAWRRLGSGEPPATYASVLADMDEITKRLEEVRVSLSIAELPSVNGQFTGTGWV
jgi:hypothetical protein